MEHAHGLPAGKGRVGAAGEAGRDNRRVSLVIDYAGVRAMPGTMPQPRQTPEQGPQQEAMPQTNSGT
jgi:hypothetical protein